MNEDRPHKSATYLRKEADKKLLKLVVLTLVLLGGGVILLAYGGWGLATAVPVLLFGAFLIVIPFSVLLGIQKWRDKIEQDAWREAQEWEESQEKRPPD